MTPKQTFQSVPKPVKDRDNLNLLELVCQLHARALAHPSKEMHAAYMEARQEMENRLRPSPSQPEITQEMIEAEAERFMNKCIEDERVNRFVKLDLYAQAKLKLGFRCGFKRALELLREQGWISVKENGFPPKDAIVLGIVDGIIRIVSYGKANHVPIYGWHCVDGDPEDMDDAGDMTHWMLLPSPPNP